MRAISVVFRRELAAYLHSAIGYVIAASVLLLGGLLFYAEALGPAAGQRLSAEVLMRFFFNMSGLVVIAGVALSVRLIAEERQSRTLALLRTAPLGDWHIVLGKFLAAFVFLAGITLLSVYMPLLVLVNGKISL
ncbi:MAG: ABC transporter permease, partial [Longimicrobiales bacterium]